MINIQQARRSKITPNWVVLLINDKWYSFQYTRLGRKYNFWEYHSGAANSPDFEDINTKEALEYIRENNNGVFPEPSRAL